MGKYVTFGEIMLRLKSPGHERFFQSPALEATFGGGEPLLEVHFFDFDEDLYGQRLEVQFVAKLRDETDFESIEALVRQMQRDEQVARDCLKGARFPD